MNSTIDWCSIAFAANRRLFRTTRQSWRFNETIQRRTVSLLPLSGHDFRVIVSLVWSSESPTRTGTISTHKFDVLLSNNRRGSTAILTGISPLIQTSLKTSWRPQRPSIDVDDYVMTINLETFHTTTSNAPSLRPRKWFSLQTQKKQIPEFERRVWPNIKWLI